MVNKEEQSAAADSTQDKFKNGEQLAQAYANLEAEFTRRSQRMSELAQRKRGTQKAAGERAGNAGGALGEDVGGILAAVSRSGTVCTAD